MERLKYIKAEAANVEITLSVKDFEHMSYAELVELRNSLNAMIYDRERKGLME